MARRQWEPEFRAGVMTWDTYVAENAPGALTFSWLYVPLLLDALDDSSSARFERPAGWWALVDALRPALVGANPRVRHGHTWNDIYGDRVTRLPLEGRHPSSSAVRQNHHRTDGGYIQADEQERLLGLRPATAQRLLAYAERESRRGPPVHIDRPVAPPLPAPATLAEDLQLEATLGGRGWRPL